MGSVRLIFLLGSITTFAHLCRREKILRVQSKKRKEKQFIFKDLFTTGKKKKQQVQVSWTWKKAELQYIFFLVRGNQEG